MIYALTSPFRWVCQGICALCCLVGTVLGLLFLASWVF